MEIAAAQFVVGFGLANANAISMNRAGQITNSNPLARYLRRLSSHSRLSEAECAAIMALPYESERIAPHRDIVTPGQVVAKACYVVEGLVGRFDQMRDGRRQITALHLPGDMCDLHSVVLPRASWNLSALSNVTIFRIPHDDLIAISDRYPRLGMAFWRDTATDAAILAKWFANLGRKDAVARIAHLLCELGIRSEVAGLGSRNSYSLKITQEDLADVTGITAVHLNRTLQTLRRTALLEFKDRHVFIRDWNKLVEVAEFDDAYLQLCRQPG